ncbi:MAG: glycosyltransferase family 39 protein [Lentisphaeria bacterium]|jgi:hypothetical protein|nr:glycosyltransferase family 39 protein [Lentisphaeria bacterium]
MTAPADQAAPAPARRWRLAAAIMGGLLVALGIALALAAMRVSFAELRAVCDRHAVDGSADFLTEALFRRARAAVFGSAGFLLLAGALVAGFSRFLGQLAEREWGRTLQDWRGFRRACRRRYAGSRVWFWLAGLMVLGLVCRLPGLFTVPARADESFTYVAYASRPLFIALSRYDQPNNHLFHTLLVYGVTRILGGAMWAVRLPAFLAGLLLIPATFFWGRRCAGGGVGLLAAALVAAAVPLVEYSTNARGYTLLCLFAVTLFLAARPALAGRNRMPALAFVASAGLGLYTVPVMAFPLLGCLLWLLATKPAAWRRLVFLGAAAAGLAMLCYLPVLGTSGPASLLGNEYVLPVSLREWFAGGPALGRGIVHFWFGDQAAAAWLAAGLVLLGGGCLARRRPAAIRPVLALLAAFLIMVVAMRRWPPPRVCVYLVPFLAVCAAAGIMVLPKKWARVAAVVLVVAQLGLLARGGRQVAATETGAFPEAAWLCDWLEANMAPNDRVFLQGPTDGPLFYHLQRRGMPSELLTRPPEPAGRCWILVNRFHGQTLASVLLVNELALRDGVPPLRPVAECGEAVILPVATHDLILLPATPKIPSA